MSLSDESATLTPAQARMAHARAARGSQAPEPVNPRYAAILEAQKRQHKISAQKRAVSAGRGVILPDDDEPPFDPNPAEVPYGHVRVRCLRRGHDKISMGISLGLMRGEEFPRFHQGDVFVLPAETADKYENDDAFGWVESVE